MERKKIEVVEKKEKMHNGKEIIFKYDTLKRLLVAVSFFVVALLGCFFLLIGNRFADFFGIVMIFIGLQSFLDVLLFNKLIFTDDYVLKEWVIFGGKKIEYSNLEAGASKRMWTGTVFFRDKRKKPFFQFFMDFETFPIGNDGFKKIRGILIEKKIIKGDEDGWNY